MQNKASKEAASKEANKASKEAASKEAYPIKIVKAKKEHQTKQKKSEGG